MSENINITKNSDKNLDKDSKMNVKASLAETLDNDEYFMIHQSCLNKLRLVFSNIPENLENKSVFIGYTQDIEIDDEGYYHYHVPYTISFSNDYIEIKRDSDCFMLINNNRTRWSHYAEHGYWIDGHWVEAPMEFNHEKLEKRLQVVIDNSDKCDCIIKW